MSDLNNNTYSTSELNQIKTVQGRWMTIDEEIYVALDIHSMSLYTALRYEGDYSQATSTVTKSIAYLCDRAKIKRAQAFKSLNKLEVLGLIKRCNEKRLGDTGFIYVSKHLGHFCVPVHTVDTPVHTVDTPVHTVDTPVHTVDTLDQESFHLLDKTNNNSLSIPKNSKNEVKKSTALTVEKLMIDNPHNIPHTMIEDWITNRKAKKAPITQTVWNKLNKDLAKCAAPIEAFEEYVAAGWQSFNPSWLNKKHGAPKESYFDNKSTAWGKDMHKELF